mgnify:CR=1 FL=1
MKQLVIGLILGMILSTSAAWAIHRIGHTTIFEEGSFLDRIDRQDAADQRQQQEFDQL